MKKIKDKVGTVKFSKATNNLEKIMKVVQPFLKKSNRITINSSTGWRMGNCDDD